jgi:hypothetical protein
MKYGSAPQSESFASLPVCQFACMYSPVHCLRSSLSETHAEIEFSAADTLLVPCRWKKGMGVGAAGTELQMDRKSRVCTLRYRPKQTLVVYF